MTLLNVELVGSNFFQKKKFIAGISIVGGRVEVSHKSGQPGMRKTVSGIFIKSVLPNSPAGLSNLMNMGDRVISVSNLKHLTCSSRNVPQN